MKKFGSVCLLALIAAFPACAQMSDQGAFHPPATAAEQALDQLLHRAVDDDNMVNYLLRTPFYKPAAGDTYDTLFTADFRNRMAAAEAEKVREECGGHYKEHQVCGFDYNPITCTEDTRLPGYFYRTGFASDNGNAILLAFAPNKEPYASYTMAREDGGWRLDDVQCLSDPTE